MSKWFIIIVAVVILVGIYVGFDGPLPEVISNYMGPTK